MKIKFDIKNKKADLEADVEKLVEKGMEQHDKNWKDKFNIKHNAKKEILQIKHKQMLENNKEKRSWFERVQENKRKQKEIELAEERRREEEERIQAKKILKIKIVASIILGLIGLPLMILGIILVDNSGDPNSPLNGLWAIGFIICLAIGLIWVVNNDNDKKSKNSK